jgi:hypothetical protein
MVMLSDVIPYVVILKTYAFMVMLSDVMLYVDILKVTYSFAVMLSVVILNVIILIVTTRNYLDLHFKCVLELGPVI